MLLPKDVVWGPGGWRSGCRFVDMTTVPSTFQPFWVPWRQSWISCTAQCPLFTILTFQSTEESRFGMLWGCKGIESLMNLCHSKCPTWDSWWTRQLIQPLLFVTASAPLHAYPPSPVRVWSGWRWDAVLGVVPTPVFSCSADSSQQFWDFAVGCISLSVPVVREFDKTQEWNIDDIAMW